MLLELGEWLVLEPEQQQVLLDRCSPPELPGPLLQVLLVVLLQVLLLLEQQGRPRRQQQQVPRRPGAACAPPGAPR